MQQATLDPRGPMTPRPDVLNTPMRRSYARRRAREGTGQRWFELRLFLVYCVIFYLTPYILFQFVGNPLEYSFRPQPNYTVGILYVAASALIFWVMQKLPRRRFRGVSLNISGLLYARVPALLLSGAFLAISIWSFLTLGLQFRQTGDALSEVGVLGFLLAFGKALMGTSIIVHYRIVKEGVDVQVRSLCLFLISLSFAVNIQGSLDIVIALAAYVAATHRVRRSLQLTGTLLQKMSLVMAPVLLMVVFFIGKLNKIGFEETLAIMKDVDMFFYSFLRRYSFHMYSVATHVEENFFNFGLAVDAIREVVSVMYFRFGSMFGLAVERPELGSIARMNFFVLADFYKDRIGASPSMLGSVFFFPGAGLAIFYYVLLLRFIFSLFWQIMGKMMDNWLFIILSVILLGAAVDALLDSINPLSNGFVRILTLYLGASYVVATLGGGRTARRMAPS